MVSLNIMNNVPSHGFVFRRVTDNDVILAVSHFISQTSGEHGIPLNIIAKASTTIVPYLTKFFNASLLKGIFPLEWKKSVL